MERIVKHITNRLIEELPEEQESYKLSELHASGIPRFVVKRVEVELERNLGESIVLPETEWADMESETVRQAWNQFVSAIRAQARLPKSYSYAVLETAVSDIMDILVQPRKNLPDVIFGAADELDYHQVVERMDAIVVYHHFASLIPRYMEKKGLNRLAKERCAKIITQADNKLTTRYTPLNWAQMLEPLFILMDEQIDSNMLRLFFEDKNKPRLSREFDLMNQSLNRSQLIEVLSSPNLPVDDDEQNDLFATKASPPRRADRATGWEGLVKPAETETGLGKDEPKIQEVEGDAAHPKEEQDVLNQFYEEEQVEDEEEDAAEFEPENEKNSLNEFFTQDDGDETDEETTEEQPAEESWQPFAEELEQEEHRGEDTIEVEEESPDPEDKPAADDFPSQDQEDSEVFGVEESQEHDAPMWQKFISSQDLDEPEGEEDGEHTTLAEEQEQHEEEQHVEEEPLIDLTEPQGPANEDVNQLRDELQNDRERFVEDIFRGADEAYEQALEEIAAKDNWRSASRFIEKEIFKRNLVDMYSEAAVNFTDRLHSYFIETDKSN